MENEVQAEDRIDDCHEGQASQWQDRPVTPERIQNYQQCTHEDFLLFFGKALKSNTAQVS